eukprot:gnl/TRDRNA2_/TRDRNA2_175478_c2_seq14.p1 gnl/TRDRNA2_/TRDRNA2_175478_c2~~gnl/TRDRNA2_/TRDRNA2_175478_c2_seq14.p1  ORF type:complete len:117 (-),score=11.64 gnl/TRDRNA2_/TRDRNA2_175478_c2_seq14:484-834(-)
MALLDSGLLPSLLACRSAALAKATQSSSYDWPTFMNAHAKLANCCIVNSLIRWPAEANSYSSDWPWLTIANAHATLVRFCKLKSASRCWATVDNTSNSMVSDCFADANAQAVLATP